MVSPIRKSTGGRATGWPALFGVLVIAACTSATSTTTSTTAATSTSTTSTTIDIVGADLILTGKIVTMTDAGEVEALAVDGGLVVAAGSINFVMSHAGPSTPVIDLGDYVAFPGFVDSHSHWIGDREHYGVGILFCDEPALCG